MFRLLVCSVALVAVASGSLFAPHHHDFSSQIANIAPRAEIRSMNVRIDHFNPQNQDTWEMPYAESGGAFVEGGPIFILVDGQQQFMANWLEFGHFYDVGRALGAYFFATQHRFYGNAKPTDDITVDSLRYLSVDQAIEDVVQFVAHIKRTYNGTADSRVILCGAEYGGSLAVWMRSRYPTLINGVWAINAPLEVRLDYTQHNEALGKNFRDVGLSQCYNRIEEGTSTIEQMISIGNTTYLDDVFNLCTPLDINDRIEIGAFFIRLVDYADEIIQSGNREFIQFTCDMIEDDTVDVVQAFANLIHLIDTNECIAADVDAWIADVLDDQWDEENVNRVERQNLYQSCTELGWFPTTSSPFQPFGRSHGPDIFMEVCARVFGEQFTDEFLQNNIDRLNTLNGGINPAVTNVYFVTSSFNPYRRLAVLEDLSETSPADVVLEAATADILSSIHVLNDDDVRRSKERVKVLIYQWLGQPLPDEED